MWFEHVYLEHLTACKVCEEYGFTDEKLQIYNTCGYTGLRKITLLRGVAVIRPLIQDELNDLENHRLVRLSSIAYLSRVKIAPKNHSFVDYWDFYDDTLADILSVLEYDNLLNCFVAKLAEEIWFYKQPKHIHTEKYVMPAGFDVPKLERCMGIEIGLGDFVEQYGSENNTTFIIHRKE